MQLGAEPGVNAVNIHRPVPTGCFWNVSAPTCSKYFLGIDRRPLNGVRIGT